MAEPIDLVVDRRVLLDVGVSRRHVRLGLVVVVVGDEVLDPVLREQLAELAGELRRERLVGRQHDRRPLHLLDDRRDREALARAGDAEQGLEAVAALDPRGERGDRLGLVAGGGEIGDELERGHHPMVTARCDGYSGLRRLDGSSSAELVPELVDLAPANCGHRRCRARGWRRHAAPRRSPVRPCAAPRRRGPRRVPRAGRGGPRAAPRPRRPRRRAVRRRVLLSTSSGTSQITTASSGAAAIRRSNSSPIVGQVMSFSAWLAVLVDEGHRGERGPVEPAVGVEDPGAEAVDQRRQRRLPRLHHRPGDLVGVDDDGAPCPQQVGDGRLARADPAREPDQQHCDGCYSRHKFALSVLKRSTRQCRR